MNIVDWSNQELIEEAVRKSKTKKECLIKLGITPRGSNYATLTRYIEQYGIPIDHFDTDYHKQMVSLNKKRKTPISKILVQNSTFSRSFLKVRLIKENIIPYVCDKCGNTGIWEGQPLSLNIEHRNGIYDDNRIENLCFLCPNCHAQTDTFAGKNISKAKTRKKVKDEREKLRAEQIEEKRQSLLSSGIDFSKHGWVTQAANILGCVPQNVNKWMKIHMLEFYESTCFIRYRSNAP